MDEPTMTNQKWINTRYYKSSKKVTTQRINGLSKDTYSSSDCQLNRLLIWADLQPNHSCSWMISSFLSMGRKALAPDYPDLIGCYFIK